MCLEKLDDCDMSFLHSYPERLSPKIIRYLRVYAMPLYKCFYSGSLAASCSQLEQ